MKKAPSSISQWADEAYQALEQALIEFAGEYPDPTDDDRLELLGFAADITAEKRGIRDADRIEQAHDFAIDNALEDLESAPDDSEIHYSILFLIVYLDVHIDLGILDTQKAEQIMNHLVEHYEVNVKV